MNHSLKPWNTFSIGRNARHIVCTEDEQQLLDIWQRATAEGQPVLILGEGSDIFFLESYRGTVIANWIKGVKIHDEPNAWYLRVGTGEDQHRLVRYTLWEGMPGLENLTLIPDYIGSSPVQNISAYGVELQRACAYVDCVELATGRQVRLTVKECRFGYRDSIFRYERQDRLAIVAVGLRLPKGWQPVLMHGNLTRLNPSAIAPQQVFDAVCHMRTTKLPNPEVSDNMGGFFKNPIVSAEATNVLLAQFPATPHYPQVDGSVRLATGWLTNQCQLKEMQIGEVAVHRQQTLVLTNEHGAKSEGIVQLAHHVGQKVGEKFNVWFGPEVRFIGASGEVSAVETVS